MNIERNYTIAQSIRSDYVDAARERRFVRKSHGLMQNRHTRRMRTRLAAKLGAIESSLAPD